MSFSVVVLIVGAAFLIIGLIGGGIKIGVKEGEASIPTLNLTARLITVVIGIFFIAFGIWRESIPSTPSSTVTLLASSLPTSASTFQATSTTESTPQVVQPQIIPTSTPVSIGTISVQGNLGTGTPFIANKSGLYIFKYVSGAYSTHSEDNVPVGLKTWQTSTRIYVNRPVSWNQNNIGDPDYHFISFGEFSSKDEAVASAIGSELMISLLQDESIVLVAVDTKADYLDNPGEVVLEVLYISQ